MCQRSLSSPGPNESSPSSQFPLPIFEGKAEMTEIERGRGILYGRARKSKIGEFRAWKQWVESYFGMPYNSVSLRKQLFSVPNRLQ